MVPGGPGHCGGKEAEVQSKIEVGAMVDEFGVCVEET